MNYEVMWNKLKTKIESNLEYRRESKEILDKAYEQGWLSGFDFSVLMQRLLISKNGYVIDVGNYENVNAEVALTLAEKIKRHPKLWKWFFMVA